jgi:hypothetical protein
MLAGCIAAGRGAFSMNASFSEQERTHFAEAVMAVLDEWGVDAEARVVLLGLPDDTKPRALAKFRRGTALPDDERVMVRIGHLLSINQSLGFTFPHNPAMAKYWVSTPNRRFGDRTPLSVMLDEGLAGLESVARHLDNSEEW